MNLIEILRDYRQSGTYSEADIRTKLILPLLKYLGYRNEYRAEEFPVYGFDGGKKNHTKFADFLLFSERGYSSHCSPSQEDIDWVKDHSLLVVEVKNTGKMPEVVLQPEYYAIWTRPIAYIITDGETIKGYIHCDLISDKIIFECEINELHNHSEFDLFSFENTSRLKQEYNNNYETIVRSLTDTESKRNSNEIQEIDLIEIPSDLLNFMKNALGKNAEGLDDSHIIKRFTNTTAALINNNMRYDIPPYMANVVRQTEKAKIYIDNDVYALNCGEVGIIFYENVDKYIFISDYLEIVVIYIDKHLFDYSIGYRVQDQRLEKRIEHFKTVEKCYSANRLTICIEGSNQITIVLPLGQESEMWPDREKNATMMRFWIDGLEKLLSIEKFYGIKFVLNPVTGDENINALYNAIDLVYCGIKLKPNCTVKMKKTDELNDVYIPEPLLLEKDVDIPLPIQTIHGVVFKPVASALLPGTIPYGTAKYGEIIQVDACCLYQIIE